MNEDDILKFNLIELAKQHKKSCNDPECGISMHMLERLLLRAGINLTKEESDIFI